MVAYCGSLPVSCVSYSRACYNACMEYYEFDVRMRVKLPAFNKSDAEEAVRDALTEVDALGATVTKLLVDLVEQPS